MKNYLLRTSDKVYETISVSPSEISYATTDVMKKCKTNYVCEFGCSFEMRDEEAAHNTQKARHKLFAASAFCFLFMMSELAGGYYANSLALVSDAAHMLSDFAGLMISIFALWLTQREASNKWSYGYHRAEILGALMSVFLIWALTIWLIYEAVHRLISPQSVKGEIMFIVAACGVAVNIIMGGILHQGGHHHHGLGGGHDHHHGHEHDHKHKHDENERGIPNIAMSPSNKHKKKRHHSHDHEEHSHDYEEHDHDHDHDHDHKHDHIHDHNNHENKRNQYNHHKKEKNINVRSAFIHVIGDLVQSIGVCISAALIWYDPHRFRIADPICTLIFSIIVMFTTVNLVRDALDVLMEGTPKHVDIISVETRLRSLADVANIHDLHVWNLSLGKPALSVHLLVKSQRTDDRGATLPLCVDGILRSAQQICSNEFNIKHTTIQIEYPRLIHKQNLPSECPQYCTNNSPSKFNKPSCKRSI